MRRLLRFVLLLTLIGGLVSQTAWAQQEDADERLDDIQSQIDDLANQIDNAQAERGSVITDLEAAQARVAAALGELADAEAAVDAVRARIVSQEAILADLRQQIAVLTADIAATRQSLVTSQTALEDQAVALYMSAASGSGADFLAFESAADAAIGMVYSGSLLEDTQRVIDRFMALRNEEQRQQDAIDSRASEVEEVLVGLADQKSELEADVERVDALRAEAESEAANVEALLASINSDIAHFEDHMVGLEAESARIEAEIQAAQDTGGTNPGVLAWPVSGPVTSPFGYRTHPILGTRRLHAGIDIGASSGTTIGAAGDGTVILAGPYGGYGNAVVIDHGGGLATVYAHQSSIAVSAGQLIGRGDVVGYVGCTGLCTGDHLHFETRESGTPVDPMTYLG